MASVYRRLFIPLALVALPVVVLPAILVRVQDATGTLARDGNSGKPQPYSLRRLPVNSFPDLPAPIVTELTTRGCQIPQSYEAHRPENAIHGSFERAGSQDWAILCDIPAAEASGKITLLVFFASRPATQPVELASGTEAEHLTDHSRAELGFNWNIVAISPHELREAQEGQETRQDTRLVVADHDAIADNTLDLRTTYWLYRSSEWVKKTILQR